MEKNEMQDEATTEKTELLDIIMRARTIDALDKAASESKDYQEAREVQDIALEQVDQAGLAREQRILVDRAVSAVNDCGAVYGEIAYKLGMHDGLKLASELKEI